jgi:hypothetical protein
VYASRDSYIEHFSDILLPLPRQKAVQAMSQPGWGREFDYSKERIAKVRIKRRHYLGLRFRKLFGLDFAGSTYSASGQLVARRNVNDRDVGRSDTIFVRRACILRFIQETNQVLLWCVHSLRYSERQPNELNLEVKADWVREDDAHYVYERMNVPKDHQTSVKFLFREKNNRKFTSEANDCFE